MNGKSNSVSEATSGQVTLEAPFLLSPGAALSCSPSPRSSRLEPRVEGPDRGLSKASYGNAPVLR